MLRQLQWWSCGRGSGWARVMAVPPGTRAGVGLEAHQVQLSSGRLCVVLNHLFGNDCSVELLRSVFGRRLRLTSFTPRSLERKLEFRETQIALRSLAACLHFLLICHAPCLCPDCSLRPLHLDTTCNRFPWLASPDRILDHPHLSVGPCDGRGLIRCGGASIHECVRVCMWMKIRVVLPGCVESKTEPRALSPRACSAAFSAASRCSTSLSRRARSRARRFEL